MTNEERDRDTRIAALISQGLVVNLIRTLLDRQALSDQEVKTIFAETLRSVEGIAPRDEARLPAAEVLKLMEAVVRREAPPAASYNS